MQKGVPLKHLLGEEAVDCLADNIGLVFAGFDRKAFRQAVFTGLDELELMQRAQHIADALWQSLPGNYAEAIGILQESLTPAQAQAEEFGLAGFFYLPHSFFIASYGLDPAFNGGDDPFEHSMAALHALTLRFTSEFAIRPFLIQQQERTLAQVLKWVEDPSPHVRRLCSEGTRPRLPWGKRLPSFMRDPAPTLPILERLRADDSLYVRRSVANHLGDIAKDHPELALETGWRWLKMDASKESKWVIRHAIRHLAKKQHEAALELREAAR